MEAKRTNMKQFDKRMNILNNGKKSIVDTILSGQFDTVVDLGCGQCVIEKVLLSSGFRGQCICVDKNAPKSSSIAPNFRGIRTIHFVKMDLKEFCLNYVFLKDCFKQGRTCFILSAVLHECDRETRDAISSFLAKVAKNDDTLIVREPYYTDLFFKRNTGDVLITYAADMLDKKEMKKLDEYLLADKKAHTNVPIAIGIVNYAFVRFYGRRAWKRELHEGRYTFSKKELLSFISRSGFIVEDLRFEKDEAYSGLTLGNYPLYDKIAYTSCLFVAKKIENNGKGDEADL